MEAQSRGTVKKLLLPPLRAVRLLHLREPLFEGAVFVLEVGELFFEAADFGVVARADGLQRRLDADLILQWQRLAIAGC